MIKQDDVIRHAAGIVVLTAAITVAVLLIVG